MASRTYDGGGARRRRTLTAWCSNNNSNKVLAVLSLLLLLATATEQQQQQRRRQQQNCSFDAAREILSCSSSSSTLASHNASHSLPSASRARRVSLTCSRDEGKQMQQQQHLRSNHFGTLPGLRELALEGCHVTKVQSLAFSGLSGLVSLTVSSPRTSTSSSMELEPDSLTGLNDLRILNLTGDGLWTMPRGALCSLDSLSVLNLSRNFLQDPSELGFSSVEVNSCRLPLQEIDLSRNRISRLPAAVFGQLAKVERLDLSGNGLNVIEDEALVGLTRLQVLDLSDNSLVALPPKVFGGDADQDDVAEEEKSCCRNLRELHLQNNSLSGLAPGLLDGLGQLLVLNLSHNDVGNEWLNADTFSTLSRLVALDLSHNRLTTLSQGLLGSLSSLQLLDLSHNRLRVVPDRPFLAMHNLHILRLSHNHVEQLRENALEGLSVLGSLALDHNRLRSLSTGVLGKCSGLVDLELQRNDFSEVPTEALKELASLRTLDIGENRISNLTRRSFDGLRTVYALRLASIGITTLQADFFKLLPNLKVLNLAHNAIAELEQGVFKELGQLRMLRLDSNVLKDINGILAGQTSLKWLNVSSNRLQWFDYAFIPKSLQWLDISDNHVEELGNYYKMEGDFKLTTLKASRNKIKKLEPLSFLNNLEVVDVSENRIKSVAPSTFEAKSRLRRVDLSSNHLRRLQLTSLAIEAAGEN